MENGNGKYKLTVEHRLTTVEGDIKAILNNHLPHLAKDVSGVKQRLNWLIGLIITTLIAVVITLVR